MRDGLDEGVPVAVDEAQERLGPGSAHQVPAAEAAAEQHEPADPVRSRPGDRGHRRVVEAEQDDLVGTGRRHDRVEVAQVRLERHVVHVALAPSRAAAVVLDQPDALAERP